MGESAIPKGVDDSRFAHGDRGCERRVACVGLGALGPFGEDGQQQTPTNVRLFEGERNLLEDFRDGTSPVQSVASIYPVHQHSAVRAMAGSGGCFLAT